MAQFPCFKESRTKFLFGHVPDSLLDRHDMLVLVNPEEARTFRTRIILGSCQRVFVMCAEAEHPVSAAMKQDPSGMLYVAPPSPEQLEAMVALMFPTESPEGIKKRVNEVGPNQRDAVTKKKTLHCKEQRESAISAIRSDIDVLLRHFVWNGIKKGSCFYPERIFLPVGVPCENQPSAQDVTHILKYKHFEDYEGHHIDYKTTMFVTVCRSAWNDFFDNCERELLTYWKNINKMNAVANSFLIQRIALHELSSSRAVSKMRRCQLTTGAQGSKCDVCVDEANGMNFASETSTIFLLLSAFSTHSA
jgi:hypothetical protein